MAGQGETCGGLRTIRILGWGGGRGVWGIKHKASTQAQLPRTTLMRRRKSLQPWNLASRPVPSPGVSLEIGATAYIVGHKSS